MNNIQDNPKLHRLYVIWAMRHLLILKKSIKKLNALSHYQASTSCSMLRNERTRLLETESAYQEAAWRLMAGHRLLTDDNDELIVVDIYNNPIPCAEKPDVSTVVIDSLSQIPDAAKKVRKPRDNDLTYEQRRQNGLKGIAVRQHNERRFKAKNANEFHIYATKDGKVIKIGTRVYTTMRGAFRYLTSVRDMYADIWIYDPKGFSWIYDRTKHSMVQESH